MSLRFIQPMLPTLVEVAPTGDNWIHEIKYDGYRTQVHIEGGTARALTRTGIDWSGTYKQVVEAAKGLADSAIIDREVIVLNDAGASDFHALRSAMRWNPGKFIFVAFDLLHINGDDLRRLPLIERRAMLAELIQFSHHVCGGAEFYAAVDRLGLEGMVSKRPDSVYRSGKTETWLKKQMLRADRLRGGRPVAQARHGALGVDGHATRGSTLCRHGQYRLDQGHACAAMGEGRGWQGVRASTRARPNGSSPAGRPREHVETRRQAAPRDIAIHIRRERSERPRRLTTHTPPCQLVQGNTSRIETHRNARSRRRGAYLRQPSRR